MVRKIASFLGVAVAMALVSYGAKYVLRDTLTTRHIWQSALVGLLASVFWHIPWQRHAQNDDDAGT